MKIKKIIAVFLSAVILVCTLSFVGCLGLGSTDVLGLKIDDKCYVNNVPSIGYDEKDYESTVNGISKLNELVTKGTATELACQVLCATVSINLYKLIDALNIVNLYYYTDLADVNNQQAYTDLYNKYSVVMNSFKKLYPLFANSKYKKIFYGDATDEEIAELVKKAVSSDELVALSGQVVNLQSRYDAFGDEQILGDDFDTLYTQLVGANNQIAKIYGYDDYMDYSYVMEYDRDFTPNDTLTFATNLSGKLPSAAQNAYLDYCKAASTLQQSKINELDQILSAPFATSSSLNILDAFYKSLGEDIYSIYKHVLSDGYYYVAQSENAYDGAFTNYFVTLDEPYMYFSSAYATVETFVHEFGHYCRYYLLGSEAEGSFELMETHSQGAEWLFMSYVSQNFTQLEKDYFINSKFIDSSYTVLISAVVGAAEVDVYSITDFNGVDYYDLLNKWTTKVIGNNIPSIYDGYMRPAQYFRFVAVNSPGYYISYSVSLISSLELYVSSEQSYSSAVDVYVKLLNGDDYVTILTENGLSSPFGNAIDKICNAFGNV